MLDSELTKDKIKFELANNLIVIPVELNGEKLSFVLDTGVGTTIIFSLENKKYLELKNISKIKLRGLGGGDALEGIKSVNNQLKIGNSLSRNHTVYMVFDDSIDLSSRMGFPVHGIIGYDFFKNFVIEVNYASKILKVYNPESYTYKKCKKCYDTVLDFNNGKRPYVKARYESSTGLVDLNLLMDSGSGSALWLFENAKKNIRIPQNSFVDFLGKGFNGDIYGKKTKVEGLRIGDFKIKNVTTSFPDSLYIRGVSKLRRQGSLGGGVLKRFNVVVNYPDKKIRFKKNKYFKRPFYYNMSGLTIQHTGVRVQKQLRNSKSAVSFSFETRGGKEEGDMVSFTEYKSNFHYSLAKQYEVVDVRKGSSAAAVGLKKGDVLLAINGKNADEYKLSDLNDLFYSKEGKKIRLRIERLGVELTYTFRLKKVI
ncbi:aspartyl protease family protein [Aquimarina hainanensis]|uniref:Aspartyl protease family protein n=1 Tax=Aquimarina hainanensis TaxID=1578017 RepID=A0ABW5N9C6_9FLAO